MDTAKKKKDNSVLTVLAHYYHHIFHFCFLVRGDFSFESAMLDTTTPPPPPLQLEAAGFLLRVSSKGAPATGGQSCAHSSDNTLSMVTTSVMLYTK